MANETKDTIGNLFQQATDTFKGVFDAGLKIQEAAIRFWTEPLNGSKSFDDIRGRSSRLTTEAFNFIQKTAAEQHRAFDAHCRTGLQLTQKTIESLANGGTTDLGEKTKDLWQTGLDAFRETAEIATKNAIQGVESWTAFLTSTMKDNVKETTKAH